jgi:hypothetical protein
MLHLAVLLANPDQEIPAIELASGVSALCAGRGATLPTQPVLDRTAIQRYRQRLSELRTHIDEWELAHEDERVARARAEWDRLMAELAAGTGLGGRTRRFSDNAERARIAVGKAIRRAVDRVGDADRLIGDHLHDSVHTGMHCAYYTG